MTIMFAVIYQLGENAVKYVFWLVVLVVIAGMFGPSKEQKAAKYAEEMKAIETQQPEMVSADGDLADMFSIMSKYTDVQRENKEKELTGKVVQWKLPVYDVKKTSDNEYTIQTTSGRHHNIVSTFVYCIATSDFERSQIESLKEGDVIKVTGKIQGVTMRSFRIKPAKVEVIG